MELPHDHKPIDTQWIYRIKYTDTDEVDKFKTKLVARGFLQKKGVDYKQTFTPVAKMTSMRVLLAIVAYKGFEVEQLDINNAYLHSFMNTTMFIMQPPRYKNVNNPNLVCQLNKSLYKIKQTGQI